jgi:Flp pilus assembly protein CpaB
MQGGFVMIRGSRLIILVAILLIVIAVAGYFLLPRLMPGRFAAQAEPTPAIQQSPMTGVVFASRDISRGALLSGDDLVVSEIPADKVIESMVTDPGEIVGRYARMDIPRGAPVTLGMVTDEIGALSATGSDAAIAIPPGHLAVSIPIDRLSSVAYALRDGDHVDIIATLSLVDQDIEFQSLLPNLVSGLTTAGEPPLSLTATVGGEPPRLGRIEEEEVTGQLLYVVPSEEQQPRTVAQRIIEDAMVLHIGTFPLVAVEPAQAPMLAEEEQLPEGIGGQGAAQEAQAEVTPTPLPPPEPPDIITLIVTPQDAVTLRWALKSGVDLSLALRPPVDETESATTSVTLQYLLENYSVSIPTKIGVRMPAPVAPAPAEGQ